MIAWRRKGDKPLTAPISTQLTKVTMDPSSVIIWKLWKWTEVCGPTLLCGIVSRRQSKYDWYFICNRFSHAPHPSRWTHVFMLVEAQIWSTRTCRNCTVHNVSYSGTRQNISLSAHYIYIYIYIYMQFDQNMYTYMYNRFWETVTNLSPVYCYFEYKYFRRLKELMTIQPSCGVLAHFV